MVVDVGYWTKVFVRIILFIASIVLIFLSIKLAIFYMPFLIAFIISLILEPGIKFLMKKYNVKRKIGAIIILIFITFILVGIITFASGTLITESSSFLGNINDYAENAIYKIEELKNSIKQLRVQDSIVSAIENCKKNNSKLHILGLLSDGGVHSHIRHLFGLLEMAKRKDFENVYVHCLGRLKRCLAQLLGVELVSLCLAVYPLEPELCRRGVGVVVAEKLLASNGVEFYNVSFNMLAEDCFAVAVSGKRVECSCVLLGRGNKLHVIGIARPSFAVLQPSGELQIPLFVCSDIYERIFWLPYAVSLQNLYKLTTRTVSHSCGGVGYKDAFRFSLCDSVECRGCA